MEQKLIIKQLTSDVIINNMYYIDPISPFAWLYLIKNQQ